MLLFVSTRVEHLFGVLSSFIVLSLLGCDLEREPRATFSYLAPFANKLSPRKTACRKSRIRQRCGM